MNIKKGIENLIKNALRESYNGFVYEDEINLVHPKDNRNGDFTCEFREIIKIYTKLVKYLPENNDKPFIKFLPDKVKHHIENNLPDFLEKIEVVHPAGFINFYLSADFFHKSIYDIAKNEHFGQNDFFAGKKVMLEYTQPNPFKPFHIGHLMSNTIGESLSRIIQFSGALVVRANYQGDVGLHVAKAIYGLLQKGKPNEADPVYAQAQYIGECYSFASQLYEEKEEIKKEIDEINKKIYQKSDLKLNEIYDWGRKITLDAFEEIYKKLGTKFDYYFFESEMAPIGEKIVRENLGKIFEESMGAIVFKGEKYDPKLHTRVFITGANIPAYETKELGLVFSKFEKENPDLSIVTTAVEQADYMRVVEKAIEQIEPSIASRMKHITHGMMRFESGKMSSRKGNVITGESLLEDSFKEIMNILKDRDMSDEEKHKVALAVSVSALKYSILRQSIGGDIIFDFKKSISFEGDSGPYLQYSLARAMSILRKVEKELDRGELPTEVSLLEKLLYRFEEVVERSVQEFSPSYISTYLIEIARAFNAYYTDNKILEAGDPTSWYKLEMTKSFVSVMKKGLYLLGIEAPEKM